MLAVRTREIIAGDAMLLPGGSRRPPLPTSARPCLARQVAAPKQSRPALQARAEYRWQRIDARLQLDAETLEHHRQQDVAADGEYDVDELRGVERGGQALRSEEHTSELQSLMRISSDVFCLKKQTPHLKYQNNK